MQQEKKLTQEFHFFQTFIDLSRRMLDLPPAS